MAAVATMAVGGDEGRTGRQGSYAHMDRHRLYLHNLQRRKQLEREAAIARDVERAGDLELERGFQVCFNGANRELGSRAQRRETPPSAPGEVPPRSASKERLLRVPGALPVRTPLEDVSAEPTATAEARPHTVRQRRVPNREWQPPDRRVRRHWDLGRAVLLKSADGEMLQIDVPWPEGPQAVVC